jgi:hypothetical protein
MLTLRNTYIDGTYADALQRRCDIAQYKYDGWWCRVVSRGNVQEYFSDTDRKFAEDVHAMPDGVFYGEYMRGTQWSKHPDRHGRLFLFDLVELDDTPLSGTYRVRYKWLRSLAGQFPKHWSYVQNYRITERDTLWKQVEAGEYEGLVYRWSDGQQDHPIVREKFLHTLEGVVVEIVPGQGKHEGRMGAVKVQMKNGTVTSVGNGFGDAQREDAGPAWLGRTMEFTANAVFESGNVRHGRFVRWREDR